VRSPQVLARCAEISTRLRTAGGARAAADAVEAGLEAAQARKTPLP
jgi:hypothetical protein